MGGASGGPGSMLQAGGYGGGVSHGGGGAYGGLTAIGGGQSLGGYGGGSFGAGATGAGSSAFDGMQSANYGGTARSLMGADHFGGAGGGVAAIGYDTGRRDYDAHGRLSPLPMGAQMGARRSSRSIIIQNVSGRVKFG